MITVILFDDEITGYCGADSLIILRKGRSPGRIIFEDWYTVCPLLLAWVPVTGGGGKDGVKRENSESHLRRERCQRAQLIPRGVVVNAFSP